MNASLFDLDFEDAKARHKALIAEIRRHDALYYAEDNPEISDADYDKLRREIEDIEKQYPELITKDSPTQTVGISPSKGFKKVKHAVPMLSLSNVFSEEDVEGFLDKIRRFLGLVDDVPIETGCRTENRRLVLFPTLRKP